ncbi:N-acetylglucosamine kinase [Amycolatopsis anabasis]|uniref:N-acetylglucosamine kinase n=1 Tax=Amycolatopsis anabasis TaxID=1840409 RepID=UPI00131D1ACB|nr:BadF/BadG/BcrA/BcrD ATPase family protein [Amycolatopsis anabasis]
MNHVVGVDAGGTSTRALVVAEDGTVLGVGKSGGANPNSHPPEAAASRIAEAIAAALGGLPRERTRACVVGMAGVSKLSDPAIAAVFARAWDELALGVEVHPVSDAEIAFASATSAADGTVLVAGTGSIAGRIRKRRMVSTAGGYGWLLGDEGSAFWIGREAVRAALDALTGGGELGELARSVLAESEVDDDPADPLLVRRRLITVVNAEPPIRLARFAPLVSAADRTGDPAARTIIERAAEALAATALATREPGEDTPVVLVGSVLGEDSPVGAGVRERLAGLDVHPSADGVLGAAWLAAVEAFGETARRASSTGFPALPAV